MRKAALHYVGKLFLPYRVRAVWTILKSVRYLREGLKSLVKRKMEVSSMPGVII